MDDKVVIKVTKREIRINGMICTPANAERIFEQVGLSDADCLAIIRLIKQKMLNKG